MPNQTIDVRSLELAVGYIKCVRELLKEIHASGGISIEIMNKYKISKLENGLIDIQFPDEDSK